MDESSEQIPAKDRDEFETIGKNAISKYYKHFKSLPRITEENHHYKVADSLYTSMLTKAAQNNLFPYRLGILKYDGDPETVKLKSMKFGDKKMQVLQEGIKKTHSL